MGPDVDAAGPAAAPHTVPQGKGLPDSLLDHVLVVPKQALRVILETMDGQVAAVMVKHPLLGSYGFVTGTLEYLQVVQQISAEYGALFILDEVQTLRLDTGGAQQLYELSPDLTPMAKIIGGGLPVGAFGGRAEIMDLFDPAVAKAAPSTATPW